MTRYLRAKRLVAQGAGEGLRAEKDRKQFENVKQVKKKKRKMPNRLLAPVLKDLRTGV